MEAPGAPSPLAAEPALVSPFSPEQKPRFEIVLSLSTQSESSLAINAEARSQEVKYYYSKRNCPVDALGNNPSPSLSRQNLPPSAASTICAPDAWDNELFEVGGFYEIDHEQLLPKSPIHLKDIRVVKVTEKTRLNVTVSFPSAFSLRKYFAEVETPVGSTTPAPEPPHPELDEQFVMGFNHAGRILRRLIPSSEVEGEVHLERFWLVAPKAHEREPMQLTAVTDEENKDEGERNVPVGSCLLALKSAGLVGWGVRRKIKYIGRHREESPSQVTAIKEEEVVEAGCGNVGRKRIREVGRKRKKKKEERRFKKLKQDGNRTSYRKVFKAPKDRWSPERYEAAELKLLDIMKVKGAVLGSPILRPALREEARKHIGDTGLLDHLLKHMAGKVVSEGNERFRRRHNPEGAMEYWLEPAELQDMRRSAGVMDPFWVPPPGWKPGEPISPYGVVCGKEIEYLKEELASLRRDIEWIRSLKLQEKEAEAQSRTDAASILKLQESYESLAKCNAMLEEQVAAMATCLQGMQEEMRLLNLDKEKKEAERGREARSTGVVGDDVGRHDERTSTKTTTAKGTRANNSDITNSSNDNNNNGNESSGTRTVRRSGFRICKPQGTFLWPNMGSSAGICTAAHNPTSAGGGNSSGMMSSPSSAVPAEDPAGVPPTPHSASSATSPPRRALPSCPVSPVAAPRAQVVVVAPRPHHPQQQQQQNLGSGERTDSSSDNTCSASLQNHMGASAFTRYGGNLEKWESDGRSGGWSTISTDLALSSSCYHL